MNRFLFLLLTCISGIAHSQNVPNGGFEEWLVEDYFLTNDWKSYGKPIRTEDAASGNYAITLQNFKNGSGDFASSSIYNIDWTDATVNKFPYDGNPMSMVFHAKYDLADQDSAYINTGFYEDGRWIGDCSIKISGSSDGVFLEYSVPIRWYTSRTPDSVYIGMRSVTENTIPKGEGFITIDDFRFENIGDRTVEILNYDFEEWTNEGVVYPRGWASIDLIAFNEWGGFLRNKSVRSGTNAYRGNNNLVIQNFDSRSAPDRGFCYAGTNSRHGYRPAFPLDNRYTYLQGYYRYTNGGGDSAEISLNVFRESNYFGDGRLRIGETNEEWAFFSIPVRYYANSGSPDSAALRLISAIDGGSNSLGTTLEIDELSFVMELKNTLSTLELDSKNGSVYPNPARTNITLDATGVSYQIYSSQGVLTKAGKLMEQKTKISIQDLTPGIYNINITQKNGQIWHKKIIKQ